MNVNDQFFDSTYQHVWKKLIPPGLTEVEAEFIVEESGLKGGERVLDLMCGYGRHAIALAQKELKVTAVDNLSGYIKEIEAVANAQKLSIETHLADVLSVELSGQFDAAICMGNSFAFFDRVEAVRLLKKTAAHLKTGGIFLINSWMIAEIAIRHFKEREWYQVDDYKYLLNYRFCFHPNRIESEQTIIAGSGKVEVLKGIDYIFSLDEMEQMFGEAGLKTRALYATPRRKPFIMGDGRIYIIVEKS